MASRPLTGSFSEDLAKTPGPGRYNATAPNTYTSKAPAYSMLGRSYMPGGQFNAISFYYFIIVMTFRFNKETWSRSIQS